MLVIVPPQIVNRRDIPDQTSAPVTLRPFATYGSAGKAWELEPGRPGHIDDRPPPPVPHNGGERPAVSARHPTQLLGRLRASLDWHGGRVEGPIRASRPTGGHITSPRGARPRLTRGAGRHRDP